MKRFPIYPGTSSPSWVSTGRAQTTNSRRYFPQSSIWLPWQVQGALWELAETDWGGAAGWRSHGPSLGSLDLWCPMGGAGTGQESRLYLPLDIPGHRTLVSTPTCLWLSFNPSGLIPKLPYSPRLSAWMLISSS
jgi:hypothetical protein